MAIEKDTVIAMLAELLAECRVELETEKRWRTEDQERQDRAILELNKENEVLVTQAQKLRVRVDELNNANLNVAEQLRQANHQILTMTATIDQLRMREIRGESSPTHTHAVILERVGDKKINVIKQLRELFNLGLKEAKDLTETTRPQLMTGNEKDCAAVVESLKGVGAWALVVHLDD